MTESLMLRKIEDELSASLGLLKTAIVKRALAGIGKTGEEFSNSDVVPFIESVRSDRMLLGLIGREGVDTIADRLRASMGVAGSA